MRILDRRAEAAAGRQRIRCDEITALVIGYRTDDCTVDDQIADGAAIDVGRSPKLQVALAFEYGT